MYLFIKWTFLINSKAVRNAHIPISHAHNRMDACRLIIGISQNFSHSGVSNKSQTLIFLYVTAFLRCRSQRRESLAAGLFYK